MRINISKTMLKKRILFFLFILSSLSVFPASQSDSLLQLLGSVKDTVKVRLLLDIAYEFMANNPDKQGVYLNQALAYSKEIKYKKGEMRSLISLSTFYNSKSFMNQSDSCLRIALVKAKQLNDSISMGTIYLNLGLTYFSKENYDTAMQFYFIGLKIFEKTNSESRITSTLNNIANVYYLQNDFKKALGYHLQSLSISRKLDDKSKIASSLNNIGMIYRDQKNYMEALKTFGEALALAKEINHKFGQSLLLNNIGKCYNGLYDYNKAIECFLEALQMKIDLGDLKGIANTYSNLGETYYFKKDYDKAVEYNLKCIEQSRQINSKSLLQNAYSNLADIYSAKKDFKNAFEFHKLYTLAKDTAWNAEQASKIQEMDVKYQTEKKDKEILKQNAEIMFKGVETKQKESQRNAILVGFILVALLALVVYRSLRDKQKVNRKLSAAYSEIELKNKIVEEKNKNTLDSIHYAKRIQGSLLASDTFLKKNLSDYFILYKPKDIVSGDFYWAQQIDGKFIICTGDCTGHGVPGAFMSLLAVSSLNEITIQRNITQPDKILNLLRENIIQVLNPEGAQHEAMDGLDCSICKFDFKNMKLEYAGANNPIWVIGSGAEKQLIEHKANKQPVGNYTVQTPFSLQNINIKKDDCIYAFTDGYADQFGGPKGKKFKYKQLKELLMVISNKPMIEQKQLLDNTIETWKGSLEQIDDILIIGIKV